jgi:UrcA family protein
VTTKTAVLRARSLMGAAAVACTLFAGIVAAKDKEVTVAFHVSTKGLDLSQPADAHKFYTRLEVAARVVCTNGNRVGLEPVDDLTSCRQRALGNAIRSTKAPLLTRIYLENHTLRDAAALGIDASTQLAAK